jgi:hypothetical protein
VGWRIGIPQGCIVEPLKRLQRSQSYLDRFRGVLDDEQLRDELVWCIGCRSDSNDSFFFPSSDRVDMVRKL